MNQKQVQPKRLPYPKDNQWTEEMLWEYEKEIRRVAEYYKLDTYPNELRIITSDQMLKLYSRVGMPNMYRHWSFGKKFVQEREQYNQGVMGLAYELVINSKPCIAYLMENNSLMMQALVIAHASYGHNSFFKGNYMFKTFTDAEGILPYLEYAHSYIGLQEEKHGTSAVDRILDAAHALQRFGVFKNKLPPKRTLQEEKQRLRDRLEYALQHYNPLFKDQIKHEIFSKEEETRRNTEAGWLKEPQENILYFLEKKAPLLEDWEREIIRIVRVIAQYFYPQMQTQVMNEGWATFWHYTILQHLYDEGFLEEGFMTEFIESHTAVVFQPDFDSPYYSGINPYTLGFLMFRDLRRVVENPTEEDKEWFKDSNILGRSWNDVLREAMQNYKDESFIYQYLSPKVIRDLKLMNIHDSNKKHEKHGEEVLVVTAIHNTAGYENIRDSLSRSYNLSFKLPQIAVVQADLSGVDRTLRLQHDVVMGRELKEPDMQETLKYLQELWGFTVILDVQDGDLNYEVARIEPNK